MIPAPPVFTPLYSSATSNVDKRQKTKIARVVTLESLGKKRNEHLCNLAYGILPNYMKQGITSKAVKKLCEYGFDSLGLIRIEASCKSDNQASYKLLERCGFILEGIHRKSHRYETSGICDERSYALLKED